MNVVTATQGTELAALDRAHLIHPHLPASVERRARVRPRRGRAAVGRGRARVPRLHRRALADAGRPRAPRARRGRGRADRPARVLHELLGLHQRPGRRASARASRRWPRGSRPRLLHLAAARRATRRRSRWRASTTSGAASRERTWILSRRDAYHGAGLRQRLGHRLRGVPPRRSGRCCRTSST